MKSKYRQQMADKAEQRLQRMRERHMEPISGKTGAEALSSMLGIELVEAEKEVPEQQIVLYLREGLKGSDSNWTKYPNEMHDIMAQKLDKPAQGVLYSFFWRKSWGYGKNYCRIGYSAIVKSTCIRSKWEAIDAVSMLKEKKFIVQALKQDGEPDTTQSGTIYRIFTPQEITSGMSEEGVLLSSIPDNGILCISISDNNSAEIQYTDIQHTDMLNNSIPDNNTPDLNQGGNSEPGRYTEKQYTEKQYTFKEDNLKNSLSQEEIIFRFYDCIGQKKLTNTKKERARECIKELIKEGFSIEDVAFAVEWTLNNSKEKVYDFSILKHTISQAIADKEKVEAKQAMLQEQERLATQEKVEEERLEKEREEIEAFKEKLEPKEREKLRQRALEEISKMGGVKQEFITEILIRAKENEILKAELEILKPSR